MNEILDSKVSLDRLHTDLGDTIKEESQEESKPAST